MVLLLLLSESPPVRFALLVFCINFVYGSWTRVSVREWKRERGRVGEAWMHCGPWCQRTHYDLILSPISI